MQILRDINAIREEWSSFEAEQVSAYQSFDWYRCWLEAGASGPRSKPMALLWHDRFHKPSVLLPLILTEKYGIKLAIFAGEKHSNLNMPLVKSHIEESRVSFKREILRQEGLDAILLTAMPAEGLQWAQNLEPSLTWRHSADRFSSDLSSLGLMRTEFWTREEKRHARAKKALDYRISTTASEDTWILGEFAKQRAAWSNSRRIPDLFSKLETKRFFEILSMEKGSGFRLHYLKSGHCVAAIAATMRRSAGEWLMFISYNPNPNISKLSPGRYLLTEVIRQAQNDGFSEFDFGLGDAHYKAQFHTRQNSMHSASFAITMRGALVTTGIAAVAETKRHLKKYPSFVQWLRLRLPRR